MIHTYLVALGSNMRVPGIGAPPRVIDAAVVALEMAGLDVTDISPTIASRPVGPSIRSYANAAARVECDLAPLGMLAAIQEIEDDFGRRRRGARWRARPLDLDIILWSGGLWHSPDLIIPHPSFRQRDFVLVPAAAIAPEWCDPVTGLTLRQISARAS